MRNVLGMLKGKDVYETAENYAIAVLLIGAAMVSIGIFSNIFSTRGLTAITAMLGAFISFMATVALIVVWLAKDMFGE